MAYLRVAQTLCAAINFRQQYSNLNRVIDTLPHK